MQIGHYMYMYTVSDQVRVCKRFSSLAQTQTDWPLKLKECVLKRSNCGQAMAATVEIHVTKSRLRGKEYGPLLIWESVLHLETPGGLVMAPDTLDNLQLVTYDCMYFWLSAHFQENWMYHDSLPSYLAYQSDTHKAYTPRIIQKECQHVQGL